MCRFLVNPIDSTRLDLVIPGEQHLYLRAATSQERQQWLVALGTAKACVQSKNHKESESSKSPDALRSKKSELRLYCDLLMQQVHVVKTAALSENGPEIQVSSLKMIAFHLVMILFRAWMRLLNSYLRLVIHSLKH